MSNPDNQPKTKKQKTLNQLEPELNDCFKANLDELAKLYESDQHSVRKFDQASFELITGPFKCGIFTDFLKDSRFLDALRDEILDKIEFFEKNNDLYKFKQSEDFKLLDLELCDQITKWLKSDVLNYIKQLTGIDLFDNQIDITASKYEFTDTLLCHDDRKLIAGDQF